MYSTFEQTMSITNGILQAKKPDPQQMAHMKNTLGGLREATDTPAFMNNSSQDYSRDGPNFMNPNNPTVYTLEGPLVIPKKKDNLGKKSTTSSGKTKKRKTSGDKKSLIKKSRKS